MNRTCPILSIVVPCFNEAETLPDTIHKLCAVIGNLVENGSIDSSSFIYFIDDGSNDATWNLLIDAHKTLPNVKALRLSRNFGHQSALLAGLLDVKDKVDCAISIDADLQQDEAAIPEFIEKYVAGAEIVFGIRKDRSTDSYLKKWSALIFYRLMEYFGTPLIANHADYRLTSKEALNALSQYRENSIFLRGIFPDMGLDSDYVYFDVKDRAHGASKYNVKKMLAFAIHGIASFSVVPLRLITVLGFFIFSISALMGTYILFRGIIIGDTIPGWVSTTLPIYFLGGLQMLSIGVLGEYIGNIYAETKSRPKYVVKDRLN